MEYIVIFIFLMICSALGSHVIGYDLAAYQDALLGLVGTVIIGFIAKRG